MGIPISQIPQCVHGDRQELSLKNWLSALDQNKDAVVTQQEFDSAKSHAAGISSLKRFANFEQFKQFLDRYIASQMCTQACMEEVPPTLVFQENNQGLQAARNCPDVPKLPALPKPKKILPAPVAHNKEEEPRRYYDEGLPWKKESLQIYTGQILAGMMELSHEGFFDNRNGSLDKVKQSVSLDTIAEGQDVLFVIDTSGSMAGFHQRLMLGFEGIWSSAKKSVKDESGANLRMGIMTFVDNRFEFAQPFETMEADSAVERFEKQYQKIVENNSGSYEPVANAIYKAMTEGSWENGRKNWAHSIVVLTDSDGLNEEDNGSPTGRSIKHMIDEAQKGGFRVSVINVDQR